MQQEHETRMFQVVRGECVPTHEGRVHLDIPERWYQGRRGHGDNFKRNLCWSYRDHRPTGTAKWVLPSKAKHPQPKRPMHPSQQSSHLMQWTYAVLVKAQISPTGEGVFFPSINQESPMIARKAMIDICEATAHGSTYSEQA